MGIGTFFKKFFSPKKKTPAEKLDASGDVRVGESVYTIAGRRWRLYKNNAVLRRIGILMRRNLAAVSVFRPVTNRKHPKPNSYNNAGAGRARAIRREQLAVENGKKSKQAA